MQLMRVVDFINKYFVKDLSAKPPILPPSKSNIYSKIVNGEVPGMRLGTQWFVDEEAWLLQTSPMAKNNPQSITYAQRILHQ
jgi:hypothetical protein